MNTNMQSRDFVLVETVWLILLITGITATITQGPSNAVAEIGTEVELTCTAADATIGYWYLSKDGTATNHLKIVGRGCSVNSPFGDHYAVESQVGGKTCSLIVFNITMEQAGVYRCSETPNKVFSILTVIENSPTATYNTTENVVVENENVIITCSLNHNGSVAPAPTLRPYFIWKDSDGENVNSSYEWTTKNTAVFQITVAADRQDIMPYTCHVQLRLLPPATADYANNIPAVDSHASSPIIEVLFSSAQESEVILITCIVIGAYILGNIIATIVFLIYYTRNIGFKWKLNDRFSWLRKMLPCMNEDVECGCCWIFLSISVFALVGMLFTICMVVIGNCSQGSRSKRSEDTVPNFHNPSDKRHPSENHETGIRNSTLGANGYNTYEEIKEVMRLASQDKHIKNKDQNMRQNVKENWQPNMWAKKSTNQSPPNADNRTAVPSSPPPNPHNQQPTTVYGPVYSELLVANHNIQPVQYIESNTYNKNYSELKTT